MQKLFGKAPILTGIGIGYGMSIAFLLVEWLLLDWAYTEWWIYIDASIRLFFGILGLAVLYELYKEDYVRLFRRPLDKRTILYLIPMGVFFGLEFTLLACAKSIDFTYTISFLIMWITQFTTGFWEEAASRGIVMSGMLLKWRGTAKGRIFSVVITGVLFGSLHVLGVIYGNDMADCLWNGLYSGLWGMFVAAVYMKSGHLLLVMLIHAAWDIIIRIPNYFIDGYIEGAMLDAIYICQDIIQLGVFPVAAILICLYGFGKDSIVENGGGRKDGGNE